MDANLIHTISIIATIVATGYYIHRDVIADMEAHTARTDMLYEMFIDILKQGRK